MNNNNNTTQINNKQQTTVTTCDQGILDTCSVISVAYEDVSTHSNQSQINDTIIADLVSEIQNLKHISHYTTGNRTVVSWKKSQVRLLEDLVLQMGTDFTRIANIMNKDRDAVKRKFKTMQKRNGNFGFVAQAN